MIIPYQQSLEDTCEEFVFETHAFFRGISSIVMNAYSYYL